MAETSQSTGRRDFLCNIERTVQERWLQEKAFEAAPKEGVPKYFITFPYPYMNGKLHLGHAFSLSKCEFAARYQKMLGKNVLFPFGFHCTGMPICASADKLKRELSESLESKPTFASLAKMGIPEEEIPNFTDPAYWCSYFPSYAKNDLISLGTAIDWRRSFITTEINPYYDSFVRWQFARLLESGKVQFGKRYTVFSERDGGPCADHDRQTGEGVGPQEYTLIKIQVLPPFKGPIAELEGKNVYLVAATLRPETMYGQTNCFLLPDGVYGAFEMKDGDVFICSERSMRNMSYQGLTHEEGKYTKLMDVQGAQLLGLPLSAPMTKYEVVYSLPMMTISMDKGTGVVTSVPSDAPDDYVALQDLKNKAALREKYGITEEMVNFEPIPIIKIPELGELSAVSLVTQLKIKSQNDRKKLDEAKDKVYKKGFHDGVMIVGSQNGQLVRNAKNLVKQEMIDSNKACLYYEPEQKVISRSGEECIVALCDQWYLTYGEEHWKNALGEHINNQFQAYSQAVMQEFKLTLEWLSEWACSRSYGLGTKLPSDPRYVIESLSDSTIYMAYYTVAHYLQGGVLEGTTPGSGNILPEQMTKEVWDYIFLKRDEYPETTINEDTLESMRKEFQYWYPLDLRCSGKDLIRNHLTMSLYNHAAIWDDKPELWPKSFFCNGYAMLNNEKMSKSTGNFLTLRDCVEKFGADASRVALAEAGDSLDDANFTEETANNAVLKLYTLHRWIKEQLEHVGEMRSGEYNYFDRMFDNKINQAVAETKKHFDEMMFREALKSCFYDLYHSKEDYHIYVGVMHKDLFVKYVETQLLVLCPITPHFCESCWDMLNETFGREKTQVVNQLFPALQAEVDPLLIRQAHYISQNMRNARIAKAKLDGDYNLDKKFRKNKEEKKLSEEEKEKMKQERDKLKDEKTNRAVIYIATEHPSLNKQVLEALNSVQTSNPQAQKKDYMQSVKSLGLPKKEMQKSMQFASHILNDFEERGPEAFETTTPFDESQVWHQMVEYLKKDLGLQEVLIVPNNEPIPQDDTNLREQATPGNPQFFFYRLT